MNRKKIREFYDTDLYNIRKFSGDKLRLKLKIRVLKNKKALAQINKYVTIHNRTRILDIGCGSGEFLSLLSTKHKYGVDINQKSVKRARMSGINARVVDIESERLPYQNNYFDLVLCMEVFEHLFDLSLLISEIKRVLKKGGHVYATVPNDLYWSNARLKVLFGKPFLQDSFLAPHHHIRFFNKQLLSGLFKEKGFGIVYLGGFHCKSLPASVEKFLATYFTNLFVSNYSIVARKA